MAPTASPAGSPDDTPSHHLDRRPRDHQDIPAVRTHRSVVPARLRLDDRARRRRRDRGEGRAHRGRRRRSASRRADDGRDARLDADRAQLANRAARCSTCRYSSGGRPNAKRIDVDITVPADTPLKISSYAADVIVQGRSGVCRHRLRIGVDAARARQRRPAPALRQRPGACAARHRVRRGQDQGPARPRSAKSAGTLAMACGSGSLEIGVAHGAVRMRTGSGQATIARCRERRRVRQRIRRPDRRPARRPARPGWTSSPGQDAFGPTCPSRTRPGRDRQGQHDPRTYRQWRRPAVPRRARGGAGQDRLILPMS